MSEGLEKKVNKNFIKLTMQVSGKQLHQLSIKYIAKGNTTSPIFR